MSITLNLDDATAAQLERTAKASGITLSQLITDLVLHKGVTPVTAPLKGTVNLAPPHDFGNPPDFDYRKALALLDEEDAVTYREKFFKAR